jgi:hypothetical protein
MCCFLLEVNFLDGAVTQGFGSPMFTYVFC